MQIKQFNLAVLAASGFALAGCNSGTGSTGTTASAQSQAFHATAAAIAQSGAPSCSSIPAWNSSVAYTGGTAVVYNNVEYVANWWTQSNNPSTNNGGSGSGQPWTVVASCSGPAPTPSPSPTPAPTPTPTPTPDVQIYPAGIGTYAIGSQVQASDGKIYTCIVPGWCNQNNWAYAPSTGTYWSSAWTLGSTPSPTPTPSPTAAPSPSPTATPTPTPAPTPTANPTPSPTATPSPTPAPTLPPLGNIIFSAYKDVGINANWNNLQISTQVANSGTTTQPITNVLPSAMSTLTWAFATGECGAENWAGMNAAQFAAQNIATFNAAGKRYIVSAGGASGVFTCSTQAGMDAYYARYQSAGLVGFDFDIEQGPSGADLQNLINMLSYEQKKNPSMRISFTLATLASATPNGTSLNALGDSVITTAKAAGLNFYVNLMVMDYGNSAQVCVMGSNGNCDMAASAEQAAKNLSAYYNIPLSKIELTPMIGVNDTTTNIVTVANATTIGQFVASNGLAGLHYWSFDRDMPCVSAYASTTCSSSVNGVAVQTSPLQYLNAFATGL